MVSDLDFIVQDLRFDVSQVFQSLEGGEGGIKEWIPALILWMMGLPNTRRVLGRQVIDPRHLALTGS